MTAVKNLPVCAVQDCCFNTINKLSKNVEEICVKTKDWYANWIQERRYRITGSTCYEFFTYTNNKNADWNKKCDNILKPKNFKTEFTEYGKKFEAEARRAFAKGTNSEVVEIGLVISRLNPWLAYSPDGIIVKSDKPVALLEIKCPFIGKTANIENTVNSLINKCLQKKKENIVLKEKHWYYGQVQLGMAVLNLNLTYFVIYSSFDKQYFTLSTNATGITDPRILKVLIR
nr:PREDICTED: uncharacterized protein LOC105678993 [Linepithema humile]